MKLLSFLILATIWGSKASAESCVSGQDLSADDIDISNCPPIPDAPEDVQLGVTDVKISLGLWELGTTSTGETYMYGSLSAADQHPRILNYYGEGGSAEVNDVNLTCWSKGYCRLREILRNPPADYVKLRDAGFQVRFFQFQTDLRNGSTGFKEISSYMDHLVKWVTVVLEDGTCVQPTLTKFQNYLRNELLRRNI